MSEPEHVLVIRDIECAVEDGDLELSAWEDEFLSSLKRRESLTDKQDDVLDRIWKRATGQ